MIAWVAGPPNAKRGFNHVFVATLWLDCSSVAESHDSRSIKSLVEWRLGFFLIMLNHGFMDVQSDDLQKGKE